MKWLITGANGQLGHCLQQTLTSQGIEHIALSKSDLDIADEQKTLEIFKYINPAVVLNAAAYTNVENAEIEQKLAFDINQIGAANIATGCKSIGARLVHFSTDYVFSGTKTSPWELSDLTAPLSVYGKSKLAGELEITKAYRENSIIVRTAWLYSAFGKNFYKTILNKAINSKEPVKVVSDQNGQPTSALDLAELTVNAVTNQAVSGTFHATNSGSTSWYEFAKLIFELAGEDADRVLPVFTSEFPSKVERPKFSVLDNRKWNEFGIAPLKSWEESAKAMFPTIAKSLV